MPTFMNANFNQSNASNVENSINDQITQNDIDKIDIENNKKNNIINDNLIINNNDTFDPNQLGLTIQHPGSPGTPLNLTPQSSVQFPGGGGAGIHTAGQDTPTAEGDTTLHVGGVGVGVGVGVGAGGGNVSSAPMSPMSELPESMTVDQQIDVGSNAGSGVGGRGVGSSLHHHGSGVSGPSSGGSAGDGMWL